MRSSALFLLIAGVALAQTHQPFQAQSSASVAYGVNKDGQQTVEITNVAYEVTGTGVPGRPQDERLLCRTTTRTKQVVDEIGTEASTTVEAWPLGVDPKQKPLYTLKVAGMDSKTVDGALLVVLRGLEDTEWWSVYKLGTGQWLFDTYVPLLGFSIRRDIQTMRYVGLESQAGAIVAVVCGRQPVGDASGDSRASVKDFDQPELSVSARDSRAHGADCARRLGPGPRAGVRAPPSGCLEALADSLGPRIGLTVAVP
jgi:hypothetical protein